MFRYELVNILTIPNVNSKINFRKILSRSKFWNKITVLIFFPASLCGCGNTNMVQFYYQILIILLSFLWYLNLKLGRTKYAGVGYIICSNFCRLLCMLLLLVARNFSWIGFQLVTLKTQLQKRLLYIDILFFFGWVIYWYSVLAMFTFYLISKLDKKCIILQNPDAYKAAWKLLKVCVFRFNSLELQLLFC